VAKLAIKAGDRKKAAMALKRKRYRTQLLEKSEKTMLQVEEMVW
jgi:hypothetical protein